MRPQKRARGDRRFRQEPAQIERRTHPANLGFDERVRYALVDAGDRQAHALAPMREDFPVAQMKAADDERRSARHVIEPLIGREGDAAALDQRLEAEALDEGAAEIVPHGRRKLRALGKGHVWIGAGQIGKRALLPTQAWGNQAPEFPGQPRGCFQGQRARGELRQKEAGEFEPVTQIFGKPHSRLIAIRVCRSERGG